MKPAPPRDQRGQSLSVLVAVVSVALLLVAGLVVDGGAQAALARRAEAAAALAARAAVDATATRRVAGVAISAAEAVAAARDVLRAYPELAGDIRVVNEQVAVQTRGSVATVFVSLIGIDSLSASGSATADLRARQ